MPHISPELITAAQKLPDYAGRMVEYALDIEPDIVVVCDRDARPIGRAFESIVKLRQIELPVRYKHISKRLGINALNLLVAHTQDVADVLYESDEPRVMVIDDYVSAKAGTAALFRRVMHGHGLSPDIHWVTLCGRGTAYNVLPYVNPTIAAPWRDRPEVIGVDYDDGVEPRVIETNEAKVFNQIIDSSVNEYVEQIK